MTVTFDAVGPSGGGGAQSSTSPLTWTHVNGGNGILIGITNVAGTSNTVTGVTYGGVTVPLLTFLLASSGNGGISIYALSGPTCPTGSNTVSVSFNDAANHNAGSVSVAGAGSFGTSFTATLGGAGGTSLTVSVSGTTTGGLIVAMAGFGGGSGGGVFSGTNGVTVQWQLNGSTVSQSDNGAEGTVASTGGGANQTVGFSNTQSDNWLLIAVEVLPIVAGGPVPARAPRRSPRPATRSRSAAPVRRPLAMVPAVPRRRPVTVPHAGRAARNMGAGFTPPAAAPSPRPRPRPNQQLPRKPGRPNIIPVGGISQVAVPPPAPPRRRYVLFLHPRPALSRTALTGGISQPIPPPLLSRVRYTLQLPRKAPRSNVIPVGGITQPLPVMPPGRTWAWPRSRRRQEPRSAIIPAAQPLPPPLASRTRYSLQLPRKAPRSNVIPVGGITQPIPVIPPGRTWAWPRSRRRQEPRFAVPVPAMPPLAPQARRRLLSPVQRPRSIQAPFAPPVVVPPPAYPPQAVSRRRVLPRTWRAGGSRNLGAGFIPPPAVPVPQDRRRTRLFLVRPRSRPQAVPGPAVAAAPPAWPPQARRRYPALPPRLPGRPSVIPSGGISQPLPPPWLSRIRYALQLPRKPGRPAIVPSGGISQPLPPPLLSRTRFSLQLPRRAPRPGIIPVAGQAIPAPARGWRLVLPRRARPVQVQAAAALPPPAAVRPRSRPVAAVRGRMSRNQGAGFVPPPAVPAPQDRKRVRLPWPFRPFRGQPPVPAQFVPPPPAVIKGYSTGFSVTEAAGMTSSVSEAASASARTGEAASSAASAGEAASSQPGVGEAASARSGVS